MPDLVYPQICNSCGRSFTESLAPTGLCNTCKGKAKPRRTGLIAPLNVGECHETMADIQNADGFVVATLNISYFRSQPDPDDTAQSLVDAFNARHSEDTRD